MVRKWGIYLNIITGGKMNLLVIVYTYLIKYTLRGMERAFQIDFLLNGSDPLLKCCTLKKLKNPNL